MQKLKEIFRKKMTQTQIKFIRSIMNKINWDARLIGIKGSRGVGKTTLLLQYIKLNFAENLQSILYVSLDNIWFSENKLIDLADNFAKEGGKYLFLDEVHKYPGWSMEIKNIYDDYPELKVVFTGSSLLEILKANGDLSRRALIYNMQGLSFREFLAIETNIKFEELSLEQILNDHESLTPDIVSKIKPLKYYTDYLNYGYYPFYQELPEVFHIRLEEVINLILETELPRLRNVNITYTQKLKQLLFIITESAPFTPNISKLSERTGLNRETMLHYLHYLQEAQLASLAWKNAKGISRLQKPNKIFLENTNLMFTLATEKPDKGNLRETFFFNQLKYNHRVELSDKTDFLIDGAFSFEIGGKNITTKQIAELEKAWIASDDIEYGFRNKIPLWLFGFLY
ncbi:ATP-binding protein [Marinilabilia sp.]